MEKTNLKTVYKNPNITMMKIALDKGYAKSGATDETFIGQEDLY